MDMYRLLANATAFLVFTSIALGFGLVVAMATMTSAATNPPTNCDRVPIEGSNALQWSHPSCGPGNSADGNDQPENSRPFDRGDFEWPPEGYDD